MFEAYHLSVEEEKKLSVSILSRLNASWSVVKWMERNRSTRPKENQVGVYDQFIASLVPE